MLLPPIGGWLPLLPLAETPQHLSYTGAALPLSSCTIEALRDTFTPIYASYETLRQRSRATVFTAGTPHLTALIALHTSNLPLPYNLNFFLSVLLGDTFVCLVAKIAETVVGCVTAQLYIRKQEVRILSLCVDAKARRQGIASQLLSELASRVRERSLKPWTAFLNVQQSNIAAFNLYTQLGFTIRANQPTYYRGARYGGAAAYEMRTTV